MRRKVKRDLSLTEKTQAWVEIRLIMKGLIIMYFDLDINLDFETDITHVLHNEQSNQYKFPPKNLLNNQRKKCQTFNQGCCEGYQCCWCQPS